MISPPLDIDAEAHQRVATAHKKLIILAHFSLSTATPAWHPTLRIPVAHLPIIKIHFAGWLLHTMLSITGCVGYLERTTKSDAGQKGVWVRISNGDAVAEEAACYRYVAELDQKRMITWGDIKNKDTTVTSTSTSASSSSMSVDRDRSPSPMNVASLSDLLPPNFLSNYPLVSSRPNASTAHNFREHLINRDQVDVYFGKYKSSSCEASHLINGFNPVWVGSTPLYTWENTTNFRPTYNVMQLLDYIAQTRGYTGGESMEAWAKLGSCFEPQLGLLLWQALHFHLDKAQLGILRVPNIGMQSLTEPRAHEGPTSGAASGPLLPSPASDASVAEVVRLPPPEPQPLTAGNLAMHDLLSVNRISAWAGAGSELHLIPFNEDAARTIDFGPKTALCAPSTDEKKALWPYNAVVDWCWGTRIVTAFGTTEIWQFSQESETSQAVQRYRRAFRKRGRDGLGGEAEEVEIGEQS